MRLTVLLSFALAIGLQVEFALAASGGENGAAVVLTPKPSPKPRINGAKVFGVRPGHPFLFTIAATGQRPMEFAADGLPEGLKLDSQTGQISGSVANRGEYVATLRAANALGAAERKFRIVVGDRLALTPHMGWNSWYVWENHVTDKMMRDAADAMVASGMINHGYSYVNIDDCWAVKPGSSDASLSGPARDAQCAINANKRFPDMKAMTDYIHHRGLKAGIYSSPGPVTCANHAGCYRHEAQDARRFAQWGFDFLKYDWCSYGTVAGGDGLPQLKKPYQLMWGELQKQDRDIVLNLCQYGMGDVWKWGASVGNSWRTAGDLGGTFEDIPKALFHDGFDLFSKNELYKYGGPGGWNDPDYLLLGYISNWRGGTSRTPLTPNEQYTHVTLWAIQAAPLIFSGDITRLDDFTVGLLCNDDVLDVDQDPLGKPGRCVAKEGRLEVWARDLEDGSMAVGLFNRGDAEATVTAKWADLGRQGKQAVRDLWRQKELGQHENQFAAKVPSHGAAMLRLTAVK
jgi:alpha-galactosidase